MTENERIRVLRKQLGLTMEAFGGKLGVTKNAISNIESGTRGVTSQMHSAIIREFDVNEEWLRTGEGEMFRPRTRGEEIGAIVKAASTVDPEEAAKFFTGLLEDMSDAEIVLMYEIFKRHFKAKKED